MIIVQANHAKINLLDMFESLKDIKTQKERALILQKMPKHVKEIFKELNEIRIGESPLLQEDDSIEFVVFMKFLAENIKNLAARLSILDKKTQKILQNKL